MHLLLVSLTVALAVENQPSTDIVLETAVAEVDRAVAALAGKPDAPYYLAAQVTDAHDITLMAEDGALSSWQPRHSRRVDVDVRVGTPDLDSSHTLRSERPDEGTIGRTITIDDDPAVLARDLWRELDLRVREARERWAKVSADRTVLVEEDGAPDLAPTEPVTDIQPLVALAFDPGPWQDIMRHASARLAGGVIRDGSATLTATAVNEWFVASDGQRVRHGGVEHRIMLRADAVAPDGTVLALYRSWEEVDPARLPDEAALVAAADDLRVRLGALVAAPEQAPYTGPVVLSDRASGVFFHEIFGHRMEGHRLKQVDNAGTFKDMVGKAVLPSFLSVVDDPTRGDWNGTPLRGTYSYDDQGVPAQRANLVENGVLRGFLESRSPHAAGFVSNGHGRAQPGMRPVSRQGNLIVTASKSVTDAALRVELIRAAKADGLPYALWIDEIQGGFTYTNRGIPNAFQVDVLEAHRVWVDGRPDELVRGIDLIGTPLVAFSRVLLAGESKDVFNGSCGAESGWVPVSGVAPALLVAQLETQRKQKGQNTPPLLPPPTAPPASVNPGGAL